MLYANSRKLMCHRPLHCRKHHYLLSNCSTEPSRSSFPLFGKSLDANLAICEVDSVISSTIRGLIKFAPLDTILGASWMHHLIRQWPQTR